MDLRVSVVFLFIFLTGGYSLKCYTCTPDLTGSCAAQVETCTNASTQCQSSTVEQSIGLQMSVTTKQCAVLCEPSSVQVLTGSATVSCCDTDLCNAAGLDRAVMMYRDSSDEKVRGVGITTRSGRKWAADTSVAQAESILKLMDIIGNPWMRGQ
ncbi:Prostate stem cell antigen [Anabarilius grahami]|uniref:Prostate stem cell antigen n=1 Tax=Anabarilius grahami TaxID=495550 RepID=A0A3N0XQM4_ANAGA|nr:Prostate stem cell antigen [Anabarilius grahami]